MSAAGSVHQPCSSPSITPSSHYKATNKVITIPSNSRMNLNKRLKAALNPNYLLEVLEKLEL